jgi:hypothetical protein
MAEAWWEGRLRFVDLGTGQWVLDTSTGARVLVGAVPEAWEGRRVRVRGTQAGGFGFGLSAPAVTVDAIALADGGGGGDAP